MKSTAIGVMAWLVGCTPAPSQQPPQYGAPPPYGTPQGQPYATAEAGRTSGCVDVMTCYGKCPGLSSDCTSRCDASGTPAAQAANAEVFRCITQFSCQDETCVTTNCAAQLQTCANTPGTTVAAAPPQNQWQQPQPAQVPAPSGPDALPAVSDAEFVFHGQDGLDYVPELNVVTQGVPVLLEGTWADTRRNFTLELHGTSYTITSSGGSAYFQSGARLTETGVWTLSGTSFTLTPASTKLSTVHVTHGNTDQQTPDPPHAWALVGARLQFTKFGDSSGRVYQVDGILISGPAPSWDNVGAFAHTLRRSR